MLLSCYFLYQLSWAEAFVVQFKAGAVNKVSLAKKKPEYRHQMVVLEKDEVLRLHDDSANVAYNNTLEASNMCEINAW